MISQVLLRLKRLPPLHLPKLHQFLPQLRHHQHHLLHHLPQFLIHPVVEAAEAEIMMAMAVISKEVKWRTPWTTSSPSPCHPK